MKQEENSEVSIRQENVMVLENCLLCHQKGVLCLSVRISQVFVPLQNKCIVVQNWRHNMHYNVSGPK